MCLSALLALIIVLDTHRPQTNQDVEIDASDEDLPAEWTKRQRKNGSMYYCNSVTGELRDNSPHEADAVTSGSSASRPRRGINRLFRVRNRRKKKTRLLLCCCCRNHLLREMFWVQGCISLLLLSCYLLHNAEHLRDPLRPALPP